MICVHCGSEKVQRYRSPREKYGFTIRRHKCLDCTTIFVSIQSIWTEDLRQRLDRLEEFAL